jgi:uncharacterized membrane protein (DUF485 family)
MADMISRGGPVPRPVGEDNLSAEDLEKEHQLEEIESGPDFRALERSKLRFLVPATIFFMAYYFALPVLVGFFGTNTDGTPGFMDTRVAPGISIAYLFALSQFIMAWALAFIYLLAFAPKIDQMVHKIVEKVTARNTLVAQEDQQNGGR